MDVIETDTADVQVNSAGATSYVNNYKIMNMLGEGTFSKVYLCQNEAGSEFALKVINKSILKRKREYKRVDGKLVLSNAFQKVQKEVAIMKKLAHSNLVRLYEVIDSPADDKLFLVLELIRGGQIMYWDDKQFRYFARNTPTGVLSKDTARECLRDVVAALDFLHRNHICHRDIKPENILLSGSEYKLADFGVAYMNEDEFSAAARAGDSAALKLRSTEGTYHFLAPECTTGDEYDPYQVDVWALGVTMFTLLVGTLPFGTSVASLSDVMTSIREDPLILPPELDSECADLLTQLMEKNPNTRITIPQLKMHPWVSRAGGELDGRQSGLEVVVTQQEIEAAFTPVNNFILVMKLKMKMSTRLNKVRKSLATNVNGTRHVEEVPITAHVVVPPSEASNSLSKTMEMTPSETLPIMTDRLQRRSSRLMESISDTMGSLTTTITRRKSQLGITPPVFEPSPVLGEISPGKLETNGCPSALVRKMSRQNLQSVQQLIPGALSNEERREGLSSTKSDAPSSPLKGSGNNSVEFCNGSTSPDKGTARSLLSQRLLKRKSSSFKGCIRIVELPEGSTTLEAASSTSKRKRDSTPGNGDPTCNTSAAQNVVQKLHSVDKELSLSNGPLSGGSARRNSMSFHALVTTPELSPSTEADFEAPPSSADDTTITTHGEAGTAQGAGSSTPAQPATRPVVLAPRLSRQNSKSFRGLTTAPDATRSEVARDHSFFPSVAAQNEQSPSKMDLNTAAFEEDAGDTTSANSPIKTKPVSPAALSRSLSRRNSTSFKALVSTPDANDTKTPTENEQAEHRSARKNDTNTTAPSDNCLKDFPEPKAPSTFEPSNSPGLLARRLSQQDSGSFRTLPLRVDVTGSGESAHTSARISLGKLSPTAGSSSDVLGVTSPMARGVDELHLLQMNSSRSPRGSPKNMPTLEHDALPRQTSPKAKLPVLEILSPMSSPFASPVTSPNKADDFGEIDSTGGTPRRRASNPTQSSDSAQRLSPVEVSRKRSSSFDADDLSSGSGNGAVAASGTATSTISPKPTPRLAETSILSHRLPGTPDASDRRATFSTTAALPLSKEEKRSKSPHRKVHRNQSMIAGLDAEGPDSALMRKTSLARVLDACLNIGRAADRTVNEAPPLAITSTETETQLSPLTPTRRYPLHVPPLHRPKEQAARATRSSMNHGRHRHISSIEPIENPSRLESSPVLGNKSPSTPEKSPARRKSMVQTPDSLRSLIFRGQSSVRLSMLDEKRGAHSVATDQISSLKSKVCGIM